jgi:hypothetical protein
MSEKLEAGNTGELIQGLPERRKEKAKQFAVTLFPPITTLPMSRSR